MHIYCLTRMHAKAMYTLQFGCAHYRPTLSSSQTVLADVEAGTDGGVENDEASNDAEFEQNGTNAIERTDDDSAVVSQVTIWHAFPPPSTPLSTVSSSRSLKFHHLHLPAPPPTFFIEKAQAQWWRRHPRPPIVLEEPGRRGGRRDEGRGRRREQGS